MSIPDTTPVIPNNSFAVANAQIDYSLPSNVAVPIELIDMMIRHIRDDRLAVRSCSLVCKAWIPLSRQHLFHSILLDHSNVAEFIGILASGSVGPYVQHLKIYRRGRDPIWIAEAIPVLASYLHPTSLELSLHNSVLPEGGLLLGFDRAEPLQTEDLVVFHDAFQDVEYLKMSIVCDSFAEGAALLATFPKLKSLDVRRDWFRWSGAQVSYETMFLPSSVRNISTSYGYYPNFFLWLLQQPNPLPISSLSLASNQITQSISSYIQSLGANLHHIAFYPNFPGNSQMFRIGQGRRLPRDHVDLTYNTGLRSITLHPGEEVVLTVLQVLSQVRSNDVERIAVIVTLPLLKPFDGVPDADSPERWSELDDLFSTHRFSKLCNVIISIPGYSFDAVQSLLPLSNSRKILYPYHPSAGGRNSPYV